MKDKLIMFISTRTPFQGALFYFFAPYFILIIFECVLASMSGRILVQIGCQMGAKIETKSASERMEKMY